MLLYALTILVGAFLLFQVEPVIAKIILPWFGGSAAVWTTSLLFFQMVLLLGYLYAHAVVRYLKPRAQTVLHASLLAASVLALPIYPSLAWKPSGFEEPTFAILRLLAVTVGLPYFLLSTTGPLLQAWYARRFKGAMPYRLYALSNAGSMFALLSYPVVFEPVFGTHLQAGMWSVAYGAFVVLCGLTAIRSGRGAVAMPEAEAEDGERPGLRLYALWMALPACASVLLLAITNHLSQNVAAIPFLWVLPLAIYLLTFILCFEGSGWYRRNPYLQLLAVALGSMAFAVNAEFSGGVPIKILIPLFSMGLFTCCMVCHGELVRLKPHPRYLTHFYLMIAAGGAVGGLLVGLVAPHVFPALYEMQIGLVACALLTLIALRADGESWFGGLLPPGSIAAGFALLAAAGFVAYQHQNSIVFAARSAADLMVKRLPDSFDQSVLLAALVLVAALASVALRGGRVRNRWSAIGTEVLALILVGYLGYQVSGLTSGYRLTVRNFYGALRVRDSGPSTGWDSVRSLTNGTINHGEELLVPARRDLPTTYYGPNSGIGISIRAKEQSGHALRVGVIGLGTGTIAAYGRPGDYYRFYEINPLVPWLAHTQFHFLGDSKAKVDIAMGDARLSLEREAPEHFDVLAVDAFSSDSIPVHLLTREAMKLYFHHLKPDGILAVHISNRYLDLEPVLAGESRAMGTVARLVDTEDDDSQDVFGATWVLMTSPAAGFDDFETRNSTEISDTRHVRLWTDDYSNLYQILK